MDTILSAGVRFGARKKSVTQVDPGPRLLGHALDRFLSKVVAVISHHQDFDAVLEMLARPGLGAKNCALLDQVNSEAPLVDRPLL